MKYLKYKVLDYLSALEAIIMFLSLIIGFVLLVGLLAMAITSPIWLMLIIFFK